MDDKKTTGKKAKKAKKPTAQEVLNGLQSGKSYLRSYSIEGGMHTGAESLVPIGPSFVQVKHIVVPDDQDGESSTYTIDEVLMGLIENGGRWKER